MQEESFTEEDQLSLAHRIADKVARKKGLVTGDHNVLREPAVDGLMEAHRRYDPSKGASFKSWVYRVIECRCLDYVRKYARSARCVRSVEDFDSSLVSAREETGETDLEEQWAKVAVFLKELPEIDQVIIHRYYFEEQSLQAISNQLGKSISCLSYRKKKAIQKLSTRFTSQKATDQSSP